MKNIRYGLIVLSLLLCSATSVTAQVSIGIGLPNVSIGINLPVFPELVQVPDYPVYYAPQMDANYFFYDGMYWVYMNDNWYASSWYNGPWGLVDPEVVPLFILRVPVRYYRQPPVYFRGWQSNAPPRWGQHWGRDWEQHRSGWNRWNRGSVPAPAPLPTYQRQYSGDRYPRIEQQHTLRSQQYRYQPRDKVIQQHFRQMGEKRTPAPAQRGRQEAPQMRNQKQQDTPRSTPVKQGSPTAPQPQRRGNETIQRPAPAQAPSRQRGPVNEDQIQQPKQQMQRPPAPAQRNRQEAPAVRSPQEQNTPRSAPRQQSAPAAQQPQHQQQAPSPQEQQQKSHEPGQEQGQKNDEERGQGRNR